MLNIHPNEMLYVYKVCDGWGYGENIEGKVFNYVINNRKDIFQFVMHLL